jgi:hypothetical protein
VLRDKYIREWEPRNVLESQMIDAICQAQTIREYWMTLAAERVAVECELERYYVMQRGQRTERIIDGTQSARDAREEAERLIVNNQGGQVNVAADQSQQTNVVRKARRKKTKLRSAMM